MTRLAGSGLFLLALCIAWPVLSATIKVQTTPTNGDFSVITIEGDLLLGDEKMFIETVLKVQDGVVVLRSDGGSLLAGIGIGGTIRLKGLRTLVPDGTRCASACALAWLAGTPRYMAPDARIGFHAAYKMENGESKVSGSGNALVGAYLNKLGLPDRAVTYIASAPPEGMTWLSLQDAETVGIDVKQLDLASDTPQKLAERQQAGVSQPTTPTPDAPKSREPESPAQAKPKSIPDGTAVVEPRPIMPEPGAREPDAPELTTPLLDLASSDAASQVQRRLHERGFLLGPTDGVWGVKSRIALREFKSLNGMDPDDSWDRKAQLALFNDSYRAAPFGYKPPDPSNPPTKLFQHFPPPPGARLHPLNMFDAVEIQAMLTGLGYYHAQGNGTWGTASQSALRDFKTAHGLAADDIWNVEVERLLTGGRALRAIETPYGAWARSDTSCMQSNNPGRLVVSAREIVAGEGVCRMEQMLVRVGDLWVGTARCSRGGQEASARVALRIVDGRLIDQSLLGSVPNPNPPVFQRCAAGM